MTVVNVTQLPSAGWVVSAPTPVDTLLSEMLGVTLPALADDAPTPTHTANDSRIAKRSFMGLLLCGSGRHVQAAKGCVRRACSVRVRVWPLDRPARTPPFIPRTGDSRFALYARAARRGPHARRPAFLNL